MKARHKSLAEALGFVIEDLQAALLEAPDAEIVELARGCWQPGAEAGRACEVLMQALRAEREPGSARQPAAGRLTSSRRRAERFDQD
jgi:hypothetical protein